MTTLVATPNAIYSDSLCHYSSSFNTPKVFRVISEGDKVEYIMAGCGSPHVLGFVIEMVRKYGLHELWRANLQDNWPPDILSDSESDDTIVICKHGMFMVDSKFIPMQILNSTFTLGSGCDLAKAAMTFGYDPKQAIGYASRHDPLTGGPVQHMELTNA